MDGENGPFILLDAAFVSMQLFALCNKDRRDSIIVSLFTEDGREKAAVLVYGEKEVAIGYLLGEENRGLEYMFVMMNHACSCADHVLSQAQGLRNAVIRGAAGILALSEDQF